MTNSNNNLVLHLKLDGINEPPKDNTLLRQAQLSIQGNAQVVLDETFGSCSRFDGKKDYLEIPNSDGINFGTNQDFTVETWVKVAAEQVCLKTNDNDIIEKWNGSGGYPFVIRYLHKEQTIFAARYDGSNNPSISTKTKLKPEQFYHIAFVKKDKKLFLYLNGQEEGNTVDTTQAETKNNSPLYIGRRGGGDLHANFFTGTIANLRIYNKALSPEEIKRDMDDDLSTIAAFNLAYPLDFDLYSGDDKESVIFIENDTKGEELVFEIRNNTEQEITLPAKTGGVSQDNYHFELRFRPDTLISPKSLQQLALVSSENWSMSSPVTQTDGIVSLYFLMTNTTALEANKTITLTLQNISASAEGGARTTRVEFLCPEFTYQGETLTHYYREKTLSIINHRGKKNIPLHVSFVESNRILNDGKTPNELILRIVNVLKDKSIPLIPASKGDKASKFIISFDVQEEEKQNKDWGLGTESQVNGIEIKGKDFQLTKRQIEEWKIVKDTEGQSPTWTITNQNEENVELRPEQGIQLTISNIISSLPSGQTNLYLRYENIPGYWDGTFICTIEKTPILYNKERNVGIDTNAPKYKLDVNGDTNVSGTIYRGGNPLIYENYEIYLRGSACESTEGENTFLKIANISIPLTSNRGLNTTILSPSGSYKKGISHDVYGNPNCWNNWANWIDDPSNVADGDVVAVASYDAIKPPSNGSAKTLLTSINALKAFTLKSVYPNSRSSYVLLFIKGQAGAMEVCQPYKGPNAHLKTTYYELLNYGNTSVVLRGMIMMWSGSVNEIPPGWALCNGQNDTPDLRDRFILGTADNSGNKIGGESSHTHSMNDAGQHSHGFGRGGRMALNYDTSLGSTAIYEAGNHKHDIDPTSTLPPYYKMAFIIKT